MDDMVRSNWNTAQALLILNVLLKALGTKVLALLALAMTFGLFCWAMLLQTWIAFAMAGAFGFGVLWPVLYIGWKSNAGSGE